MQRRTFIAAGLGLGTMLATRSASADVRAGFRRVAISHDGNYHDRDDWAAGPMMLALWGCSGFKKQALVHFDFNCNPSNTPSMAKEMSARVQRAYRDWGHSCPIFDDQIAFNASVSNMAMHINASSPSNMLAMIAAGPMHVIYHALARSNRNLHRYVGILSHSDWNNKQGTFNLARIFNDFPHMRSRYLKIPDQNKYLNTQQNSSPWRRLIESDDSRHHDLYEDARTGVKRWDYSDAGMGFFALEGVMEPRPYHLLNYIGA